MSNRRSTGRRGAPPQRGGNGTVAIDAPRINDAELVKVGVFRQMRHSYDPKTNRRIEGQEYEATMLSLYFDSGHIQRDANGEPVLDADGNEQPHLINDGFVAITKGLKGKLANILKALGFRDPRFYDDKGMLNEAYESMVFDFGWVNNEDYSDADWDELPLYPGSGPRANFEVPVVNWTILGYPVIGRKCDISLVVDDSGYNKVENYMVSANFAGLDAAAKSTKRGAPASSPVPTTNRNKTARDKIAVEVGEQIPGDPDEDPYTDPTPFDDNPSTKRALYVDKAMKASGIKAGDRIKLLAHMLEDETVDSIANISIDNAVTFKAMIEIDDGPISTLRKRYIEWQSQQRMAAHKARSEGSGSTQDEEDGVFGDEEDAAPWQEDELEDELPY